MHTDHPPSRNVLMFIEELQKQAKRLALQYDLSLPEFVSVECEEGVYINLTCYQHAAQEQYAALYQQHAESLGMESSWLGASFENPQTGRKLTVLGLDPDGGDHCVRLHDQKSKHYHMKPAAVAHLLTKQGSF